MNDTTALKVFVREIMNINVTNAGMGGASAGILGTAGLGDQSLGQLKRAVIEFASEFIQNRSDKSTLLELSDEIEGSLQTLRVVSAVPDEKIEELFTALQNLIDTQNS